MDGFQKRKAQKQASIIAAALRLYQRQGMNATTMAEIAAEAGVSKVTIFKYYESKEKLTKEVILHYITEMYEEFRHVVESPASFEEKLETLIFFKNDEVLSYSKDFVNELMAEYNMPDSVIQHLFMTDGLELYKQLFLQGKREGIIRENLSIEAMLLYLNIFSEGMKHESIYKAVLPFTKDIMDLFIYGLKGRGGSVKLDDEASSGGA